MAGVGSGRLYDLMGWPVRRWWVALAGAALVAVAIGVPTGVVPNPWFARMTEVAWWNWPVWAAVAALAGLVLATYVRRPDPDGGGGAGMGTVGGGVLGFLAVGCPVCNKAVVALLGTAGAMQWWAPVQPLLGVASLALLGWVLWRRLGAERACAVPDRTTVG
jgi:hypothetical protein